MRRLRLILCAAAAGGGLGAAGPWGSATATATTAAPPRAQLTLLACRSTPQPAHRRVSIITVMRPVPGTRTLSVRVSLLEKRPGALVQMIGHSGDLGRWVTPAQPTLGRRPGDVWKLAKVVYDVDAPATYRFRVSFRWLGAHGRVLKTATRQSGRCSVRELRPDVLVRDVAVAPVAGRPGRDRYVAVIANRGATASGPFSVLFTPGNGRPPQSRGVGSLRPRTSRRIAFVGPTCDGTSPPTVVADPTDRVDDYDRSNNALTVACPPRFREVD